MGTKAAPAPAPAKKWNVNKRMLYIDTETLADHIIKKAQENKKKNKNKNKNTSTNTSTNADAKLLESPSSDEN
jgi:hypothetical protein